jgi:hypothetical protein
VDGADEISRLRKIKKGIARSSETRHPLKLGMKKGKVTPTALEATLSVIFYPLDFNQLAIGKTYPH